MFHEMLHLRYPVDHHGVRRRVHTREFRAAEKTFPQLCEESQRNAKGRILKRRDKGRRTGVEPATGPSRRWMNN